ncbi:hypothetical protein LVJ94_17165 [Pendulispora rubella]|uniref:Uncharacterized protein n=1 Tax=Pendulispora rubella TaxID=2741070 RepID=A0ABZ2LJG1_9BACT
MNADLRLPGTSSAERVEACPGSEVILDRVREGTIDATRGVGIHDFAAAVLDRGENPEDAPCRVDLRWHPMCARLDLAKIRSGIASNLRAEVAYALDLESERVLPAKKDTRAPTKARTPKEVPDAKPANP